MSGAHRHSTGLVRRARRAQSCAHAARASLRVWSSEAELARRSSTGMRHGSRAAGKVALLLRGDGSPRRPWRDDAMRACWCGAVRAPPNSPLSGVVSRFYNSEWFQGFYNRVLLFSHTLTLTFNTAHDAQDTQR
eukprot:3525551-Prymnesium_polylepis.1